MGCKWLTYTGTALEIAGFICIAVELDRVQRHELGRPATPLRVWHWIRAKVLRRPVHRTVEVGASLSATASLRVHGSKRQVAQSDAVEERLAALEANIENLGAEIVERAQYLEGGLDRLRQEVRAGDQELRQQQAEQEQERKDYLRTSVLLEGSGVVLFVIGAIASMLGNTITC